MFDRPKVITVSACAANAQFISWIRSLCLTAQCRLALFISKKGGIPPFNSIALFTKAGERVLQAFPSHPWDYLPVRWIVSCQPGERLHSSSARVVTQELHCSTHCTSPAGSICQQRRVWQRSSLCTARVQHPEQELSEKVLPKIDICNRLFFVVVVFWVTWL